MPFAIQKSSGSNKRKVRTTMPVKGSNEIILPQFIKPSQATKIQNLFINLETELYERGGIRQLAKVSGNTSTPKIGREWTSTLFIIGYGTILAVYNLNDDTINVIKNDFSQDLTDGVRYGFKFYSCNGKTGDVIYETTLPSLGYNTQTVNFSIGEVITDTVTGATATIVTDTDAGVIGTLELDNINGTFGANLITGNKGGSATSDGAIDYTNTAAIIASAGTVPKCEALSIFDKSLVAINTNNDDSEHFLAKQNDFTNWDTTSTNLGDAYSIIYSFAGAAKTSSNFQSFQSGTQSYGNVLVAGYESGYAGFERSTVVNSSGTNIQVFKTVFEKLNDGMEKNSLSTPQGIFFTNENGIFLLIANTNGGRIDLTKKISRERKANFDFTDSDIVWDSLNNRTYVFLKENSDINNLILWFDTTSISSSKPENLRWGEIPYSISRGFMSQGKVYGIASTSPRVLEMFNPEQLDDEGGAIDILYDQPMNQGALETVKNWHQLDLGGEISPGGPYTVKVLGIQEEGGEAVETGISYTWQSAGSVSEASEFAKAEQGKDGFVATPPSAAPVWTPATGYKKAYNYNSYILRLSSSDKLPATIRYATGTISEIRNQRKNILISN